MIYIYISKQYQDENQQEKNRYGLKGSRQEGWCRGIEISSGGKDNLGYMRWRKDNLEGRKIYSWSEL